MKSKVFVLLIDAISATCERYIMKDQEGRYAHDNTHNISAKGNVHAVPHLSLGEKSLTSATLTTLGFPSTMGSVKFDDFQRRNLSHLRTYQPSTLKAPVVSWKSLKAGRVDWRTCVGPVPRSQHYPLMSCAVVRIDLSRHYKTKGTFYGRQLRLLGSSRPTQERPLVGCQADSSSWP